MNKFLFMKKFKLILSRFYLFLDHITDFSFNFQQLKSIFILSILFIYIIP